MDCIKCIIVDDEIPAQDRLENILRKFEYLKLVAKIGDPDEAIEKIILLEPDLVFIDVEMPGKSGYDVIEQIRNKNSVSKFIFVTGYNQTSYTIKAIRSEAFDYLTKPIDIDDLKKSLERFINYKRLHESNNIPQKFIDDFNITETEAKVIRLLLFNYSSQQIADELFIAVTTVSTHRKNILRKININSTIELLTLIHKYKNTH